MEARVIIETLGMQRHPEGGWYVETFRDSRGGMRGHSTAIYYLLERGEQSHWHRVTDAVEIWHHYAGDPLALMLSADGTAVETLVLGPDIAAGQRPQGVVPANAWQSAEPLGDWTLVGCTVAPGFDFASFEMAPAGWRPGTPG
ncbi:cupin domain-containing protein [Rhizobium sp. TRM95111]|uniref:cupin domain-containing protein n=1 Tax=Rhizobium alarense TaxID=2846851 RepID=UPI001F45D73E|nr:cupin domain-containing protein [Rhizobium alarense]MCF3641005.1 cupin domain-containing protein [Rhizobium alarense]